MNILLFHAEELGNDSELILEDYRARHLISVIGVAVGQSLRVGQIGGQTGQGIVLDCGNDSVLLRVTLSELPIARHRLSLILALPRPKMLRRVLRTAAEFGVGDIHLIHSYRVEKSFWQSPLLRPEKMQDALIQGLERSGDTLLPRVTTHQRFKPFIEDVLPSIAANKSLFIAHPAADAQPLSSSEDDGFVIIGPEGGFIPYEVDKARAAGAIKISLAPRILSVDTAVCSALAQTALTNR
ncbi:MAG: 16S rRNA (uracil(1498)-N(3))-methyltransferase [Halieaceae bacterium MED-G27]|nr:MAG: 16S rRNA (uracil(1498)-N(3))-methyltransferase [Halieaceae bacterium MED-G27]